MGKFHGIVGYANSVETAKGVYTDEINERYYYGDVIDTSTKWVNGVNIMDNLDVSTRISVIADAFAWEHFSRIKYCEWMGVRWKVINVKPARPRLILTLGGEYNGEQAKSAY